MMRFDEIFWLKCSFYTWDFLAFHLIFGGTFILWIAMSLVHHFTFLHWHLATFLPFNRLANFFRNILTFFFVFDAADFILDISALFFINRATLLLRLFIIAVFVWFFHLHGSRWTFFTSLTNFLAIGSRDGFVDWLATSFRNFFAFPFRYLKSQRYFF